MTEVEKWMLKHYTQDLDTIKCNYCDEIFSDCNQMQNFKYHISNIHNVLELEEHPEYDNIQQNYKISSLMATCNHCKKTINLAFHGVHVLTIHLKIFHSDNIKIKILHVRNKYDITGNKAICRGCKRTLKIERTSAAASLRHHLHYCPHFKIDFPLKKDITYDSIRKRSHIWDKCDIKNNKVMCRGCKKTLEIKEFTPKNIYGSLYQHLHYCPHFKIDFLLKKEITYDSTPNRSHVWDKYDVIDNNVMCKGCKKTLKIKVTSMHVTTCLHSHLRHCPHFKTDFPLKKEITYDSTRKKSHIWDKYDIKDNKVTCKGCKKTLKIKVFTYDNLYASLYHHLRHCPYFKIDFPLKKKITYDSTPNRSHVWDKYDVIDNNVMCKGCKKTLKIKVTSMHVTTCLRSHLRHCPHFRIDFPGKKQITRKRSRVWDKYDVIDNNAMCKGCKKTLKVTPQATSGLLKHLRYCPHFKIDFPLKKEIMYDSEIRKRSHVWDKYDITDNNVTCKGCKKTLKVTQLRASILLQHLRYCPYFKTDFPIKKVITKNKQIKKRYVWDKFDVIDNNATCKGCKKTLKITRSQAASRLLKHLRYCPKKLKKLITHMGRTQCNRQQCEKYKKKQ